MLDAGSVAVDSLWIAAPVAFGVGVAAAGTIGNTASRFGAVGWSSLGVLGGCLTGLQVLDEPGPVCGLLAWSATIVAVDAAVMARLGRSLLRSQPERFVWLAVLSIFLWVPLEWYGQRLGAWYRAGLPLGPMRYVLLGWGSACIWPAIFELADLVLALGRRNPVVAESLPGRPDTRRVVLVIALGVVCLVLPLMVPRLDLGENLIMLPVLGFLLVLDPLNWIQGRPSLWSAWLAGRWDCIVALAVGGIVCGLLADSLNVPSDAGWYVVSPFGSEVRVFEMPLVGYFVLPVVAWQAFAMHAYAAGRFGLPIAGLTAREDAVTQER